MSPYCNYLHRWLQYFAEQSASHTISITMFDITVTTGVLRHAQCHVTTFTSYFCFHCNHIQST